MLPLRRMLGVRIGSELRTALWKGNHSGYVKYERPGVARMRANPSPSGSFWPVVRDEAWTQLQVLSIEWIDPKAQTVRLHLYSKTTW